VLAAIDRAALVRLTSETGGFVGVVPVVGGYLATRVPTLRVHVGHSAPDAAHARRVVVTLRVSRSTRSKTLCVPSEMRVHEQCGSGATCQRCCCSCSTSAAPWTAGVLLLHEKGAVTRERSSSSKREETGALELAPARSQERQRRGAC